MSRAYRRADPFERRMIEIRYTAGFALRAARRRVGLSQRQLAAHMDAAQSTISKMERGSMRVSLDLIVRAFILLGLGDDEIAAAFNPGLRHDVKVLRGRVLGRFFNDGFDLRTGERTPGG